MKPTNEFRKNHRLTEFEDLKQFVIFNKVKPINENKKIKDKSEISYLWESFPY
jgi:hypothetical protein